MPDPDLPTIPIFLPFGKKILIVHVHGGSVTQGSFDDQIRHAITKISHIHLTPIKEYADRIHQMGEEKWKIDGRN